MLHEAAKAMLLFFSHVLLSATLGLQRTRLPWPTLSPRVCSNSCPSSQWCHPTIWSCHPLLLLPSIFPSIRVFSNELALRIRWPKYWSFSFSISPSNEYSGLISFRMDWFNLVFQGTLKSLLQHHSSKASILQHSAFYVVQLSQLYITDRKTVSLTMWTFVGKLMSLPFNMLSRFVHSAIVVIYQMHPQDLCIILHDPQNSPEENTLPVSTLKPRELELRWVKWFTKVTQSLPRPLGNKTYMSTLLGSGIQFWGITNVGKEGIGKDRGEANSKWCITVSFSSELSAWSHVILWRVWTSMQNHWVPSWRGRACSWFSDFFINICHLWH